MLNKRPFCYSILCHPPWKFLWTQKGFTFHFIVLICQNWMNLLKRSIKSKLYLCTLHDIIHVCGDFRESGLCTAMCVCFLLQCIGVFTNISRVDGGLTAPQQCSLDADGDGVPDYKVHTCVCRFNLYTPWQSLCFFAWPGCIECILFVACCSINLTDVHTAVLVYCFPDSILCWHQEFHLAELLVQYIHCQYVLYVLYILRICTVLW